MCVCARAVGGRQAAIRIWDARSWKATAVLEAHKLTVTQLAFSPDDTSLLSVSRDRSLCVFASRGEEVAAPPDLRLVAKVDKAHERIIWACSWAADSCHFATGSRDKTVKVWAFDGVSISCLASMGMASAVTALDWAPPGTRGGSEVLAVGTEDGNIAVYGAAQCALGGWSLQVRA